MVEPLLRGLLPALLCALGFAAAAQPASVPARRADPLDAEARVPAVAYTSAFSRYPRAAESKAIPWRDANDTTARIGGWRAYAREAQQPDPAASAPAAPAIRPDARAMPMPPGHGGHKTP
jgi:hypothetical protein